MRRAFFCGANALPLVKSASKAAIKKNIKTEMAAGRPQRQAVAIALNTADRAKKPRVLSRLGHNQGPKHTVLG